MRWSPTPLFAKLGLKLCADCFDAVLLRQVLLGCQLLDALEGVVEVGFVFVEWG